MHWFLVQVIYRPVPAAENSREPLSFENVLARTVWLDQYFSYANESVDPNGNAENQIVLG